ncbi:unnamed protein product [Effrenium voratum]|nr:unnamed protein product [Effrenium voratum]
MAPSHVYASRAGRLLGELSLTQKPLAEHSSLGQLSVPRKPVAELGDDSVPGPGKVAKVEERTNRSLISPRATFYEKRGADFVDLPRKPDRLTHDHYLKEVDQFLKEVHQAPRRLEQSIESRQSARVVMRVLR